MLKDIVKANRSYRRFREDRPIEVETLRDLVDLARQSPSAGNLQPLKFIICADTAVNSDIFTTLAWAGYLTDWQGPVEGERPTAYIIILADTAIRERIDCDHGIAAQSIMLGAAELGLGGCMIGSVQRERLRVVLSVPDQFEILLVLALGYPAETVVIEETAADGRIEYWRDDGGVHHVPKRPLEELIIQSLSHKQR